MDPEEEREIVWAVARLEAHALAFVGALLGGLGLFFLTAFLLLKGGSPVGPHLQLLGQYFWGYTVTWPGAFVGFVYGGLTGALLGWLVGALYNLVVGLRS